eukprot:7096953-Prymnesium_polylepis.1
MAATLSSAAHVSASAVISCTAPLAVSLEAPPVPLTYTIPLCTVAREKAPGAGTPSTDGR